MVVISYNYSFTPIEIDTARKAFYSIPLPPTVPEATICFDGLGPYVVDAPGFPPESTYYQVYNQYIITAKTRPPAYNLSLTGSVTSTTGRLHLKILPADTLVRTSVYTFIAVCEDSVPGFEKNFNYVIRKLYKFPISLVYPDSLDTIINFQHSISPAKMTGVVFLQDIRTKEVLQAIKTRF